MYYLGYTAFVINMYHLGDTSPAALLLWINTPIFSLLTWHPLVFTGLNHGIPQDGTSVLILMFILQMNTQLTVSVFS